MLLKLADVLETDVNAVIHGQPFPESKKTAYKWAIITGGLAFLIIVLNVVLEPFLREALAGTYRTDILLLRYLNKEILTPVALFFFGWILLHWLSIFSGLRRLQGKSIKIGRIILLVLGGIVALVLLPFYIWQYTGAVRALLCSSVATAFPRLPVYHEILQGILFLTYKTPIFYCVLGGLYWLFGIPGGKKVEKI